MPDSPDRDDGVHGDNPLEQQRALMDVLSQETRHSIIQTLLGHPHHLASVEEINYFVTTASLNTIEDELEVLVDAGIIAVHERPSNQTANGLPWQFYGFTAKSIEILGDFNYLKGVPMMRAVHQRTRKTETIERHQNAPRPALDAAVRYAFRLDEDGGSGDDNGGSEDDNDDDDDSGGSASLRGSIFDQDSHRNSNERSRKPAAPKSF